MPRESHRNFCAFIQNVYNIYRNTCYIYITCYMQALKGIILKYGGGEFVQSWVPQFFCSRIFDARIFLRIASIELIGVDCITEQKLLILNLDYMYINVIVRTESGFPSKSLEKVEVPQGKISKPVFFIWFQAAQEKKDSWQIKK